MWWLLLPKPPAVNGVELRRMLVLALFEQRQLLAKQEYLLLLHRQRVIQALHRVLLESELALQFRQLTLHLFQFCHRPPSHA